ncbi:MAG TPA: TonB-dependent receptor [Verrucomicrobiae bacterium]|nr:TonB-dependent receptor [Verrucomicrobiae bacterium]
MTEPSAKPQPQWSAQPEPGEPIVDTGQKAFHVNLDSTKYGTFAEIGAGQEVARWFFRVGGAAGTVAKTISAYDKTVSDAIYGSTDRYVSRRRLQQMLDYEYNLLIERLDAARGATTCFFAFANTVAARSYTRKDDSNGWLGIKFQAAPRAEPSQVMIHVRMLDEENVREQEALGIIGVNLIYGALFHFERPQYLITSLLDHLSKSRVDVDMIKFSGPAFAKVDNRLISLQLVEQGLTEAVMFTVDGEVVQPSEVLYKKPVLVERGTFRPVNNLHVDMLECARRQFMASAPENRDAVVLMEITMRNLLQNVNIQPADFLARVDTIGTIGKTVMVTRHGEFFRVVEYLRRSTQSAIGMAVGMPTVQELLDERYYTELPGGLLEALGRLFEGPVRLYVYPRKEANEKLITTENIPVPENMRHLLAHLWANHLIEDLQGINFKNLDINYSDLLKKIRAGDPAWETMVPASVRDIIKSRHYFGYGGGNEE